MKKDMMPDNINFEIIDVMRFKRRCMAFDTCKRDFSVISCRIKGNAEFMYNNEVTLASPTKYLYIPSDIDYTQKSNGEEEIVCVHFKSDSNLYPKIISFNCNFPQMKENFLTLNDLWTKKKSGYTFKCKSIMYDILYNFHKIFNEGNILNSQQLISGSMEYIHSDYYKSDFSLSKAISLSNISEAYFRRKFKDVYKMTPIKYIQILKVGHAKTLLQSCSYSICEISQMCGFTEEKYFYTVFKKVTGQTPSEWKNTN